MNRGKPTLRGALTASLLCIFLLSCAHLSPIERDAIRKEFLTESSDAYYHYTLGTIHAINGNYDTAVEEYRKSLEHDPSSTYLMNQLAVLHIRKQELTEAIDLLERASLLDENAIDTHILLGSLYGRMEEYPKAAAEYEKALELDPRKIEVYLYLSSIHRRTHNYSEAVSALNSLLEIEPHNLMGCYQLGQLYAEMNLLDKAEVWLKKTLDIKPTFEAAMIDLAEIHHMKNDNKKAVDTYRKFIQLSPMNVAIRLKLAHFLFKVERYDDAIKEYHEVLRLDATNTDALFSLGLSYYFVGEHYGEAIDAFITVLDRYPNEDKAQYFLASSYEKEKRLEEALNEFSKVSANSKFYSSSRIHMGFILKERKRLKEAITLIEDVLGREQEDPDLYGFLAILYEENSDFAAAEKILLDGIRAFPKTSDLYYKLGGLYGKMNRYEDSIAQMRIILEIDPENADALNYIGYSYAERGINLKEAESLVKKALSLKPENGFIIDSLGWVYYQQNRFDLAVTSLRKAARLLPDDPIIAEHLGDAYLKIGRLKDALAAYKKALEKNPENNAVKEKIGKVETRLKRK